jgi:hypothetical protein
VFLRVVPTFDVDEAMRGPQTLEGIGNSGKRRRGLTFAKLATVEIFHN